MNFNNKTAHHFVSLFGIAGCVVVGSYARSSHESSYQDLDFISLRSLNKVYNDIKNHFDKIEILKKGTKYMQLLINEKYHVDIWYSSKSDFYKTYLTRTLPKEKIIYLNKALH